MTRKITLTILVFLILTVNPIAAQEDAAFPKDAQRLWELARDLWAPVELQASGYIPVRSQPHIAEINIRQGCLLLEAAVELDPENAAAWHDLLVLYTSDAVNDPGRAMEALINYNQLKPRDTLPVETFVQYRRQNLNDRPTREQYLIQTIPGLREYPYIQSIMYSQLGILTYDKGDQDTARAYFEQAFTVSNYNDEALAHILALDWPQVDETNPNLTPEQIQNQIQVNELRKKMFLILRWRLRVLNNPYDFQALMNLIAILEKFGYQNLTQVYYDHAHALLTVPQLPIGYDIPNRSGLAKEIRFKQMVSCYVGTLYDECITIAQSMLKRYPDDLLVNGLMAKAMLKLNPDAAGAEASLLLSHAADRAMRKLRNPDKLDAQTFYQLQSELAWFFCFFDPDPVRALQYARTLPSGASAVNHNWLIGRDSSAVSRSNSILAYAHVVNNQWQKAEELLRMADPNDPVSALTEAKIRIHKNQNAEAVQILQNVELNSCGILAEPIETLLPELQPDVAPADSAMGALPPVTAPFTAPGPAPADNAAATPEQPDPIETALATEFSNNDLRIVKTPENVILCSMWLSSDIFQYGSPINAKIYLTNVSDTHNQETAVVLAPNNFLDPHLLITAHVYPAPDEQGAKNKPLILAHRYLIQKRILEPGQSNVIEENLCIGPLRKILEENPRQSYRITFTLYLDPVPDDQDGFQSKIATLQPKPVTVTRRAFIPTTQRMNEYTRALQNGTPDERIKAVRLFAALLREMKIAPQRYRNRSLNSKVIRQMIAKNLSHSDFRVRAWAAQTLAALSPLDPEEAKYMGDLISDKNWFVRFMAIQTLSSTIDLAEYFRWSETLEKHAVLKRQIQLLRGMPWQVEKLPEITLPQETEPDLGAIPATSGAPALP